MRGTEATTTFTSKYYELRAFEVSETLGRRHVTTDKGTQVCVRDCPYCESVNRPIKGKKDNQWKLYFRNDTGAFRCNRCNCSGSWYDYKRFIGDLPEPKNHRGMGRKVQYRIPQKKVYEYSSNLIFDKEVLNFFEQRKIPLKALEDYRVGSATYEFTHEKNTDGHIGLVSEQKVCMTFPFGEMDKSGNFTIHRVKARCVSDKSLMRFDPAQAKPSFFGWHLLESESEEIVLTEGELDAMSVYAGTDFEVPAVSLPNGANSFPLEWLPQLERFKKIYLWLDDDNADEIIPVFEPYDYSKEKPGVVIGILK